MSPPGDDGGVRGVEGLWVVKVRQSAHSSRAKGIVSIIHSGSKD
jgi:hypothetical protein